MSKSFRLNDHHMDRLPVAVPGSDGFTVGTDGIVLYGKLINYQISWKLYID
jgi:hypothetical protein